jgi:predicted dehydrogenase
MSRPRIAVVGAGAFGCNHLRVIHSSERATLAGVFDIDSARAAAAAQPYAQPDPCPVFETIEDLARAADAAVVATPTVTHSEVGCRLMELGLDVLVEKPIAHLPGPAGVLVETAKRTGRVLQVGHLERFNPAVIAVAAVVTKPLFFEIHRLSEFTPRSLDVDVVLDLMIHDIDIVLAFTGETPKEIRAAGISILTPKVDIANARLQFPGGCVANLTASRVSTERVRKLRLFQPHEYISLDYTRKDAVRFRVKPAQGRLGAPDDQELANTQASQAPSCGRVPQAPPMAIDFSPLPVTQEEPLRLELEAFFESVTTRRPPLVTGAQGLAALEVASGILDRIEEHSRLVAQALETQALQRG